MEKQRLDAADVLNWDRLCEIAEYIESQDMRTFADGMKFFAYGFTSTADVQAQNRMLQDLLEKATYGHSRESNEDVIERLAAWLRSPQELLREFAEQNGIRLKRG